MSNEDVHSVLSAVQAFLRQQQEDAGSVIYRSARRVKTADASSSAVPGGAASGAAGSPHRSGHDPITNEAEAPVAKQKKSSAPQAAPPAAPEHATARCAQLWEKADTLGRLNEYIRTCADCPLAATRTNFVFGVGPENARVMVIGEAPGADEDAQGEPFVGRAGQLLNKILESIHFRRDEVFIANILKCRPPGNRRPLPSEVEHCEPYLWKQIELISPKLILCLGLTAAQTLLKTTASLGTLRETTQEYRGIPLVVTYHPAALLRNPNWKRPTWEDVKKLRKMYDELI